MLIIAMSAIDLTAHFQVKLLIGFTMSYQEGGLLGTSPRLPPP